MENIFLRNHNPINSPTAEKLILSAFDYFSQNYKKNIILTNNSDNQDEEKIQQLKINDSNEITCKSCVGLYPLEGKGRIYFDSFCSYPNNQDKLFEYIVKSLHYLDSENGIGIYCVDNLSANHFLKNIQNIYDLRSKGYGVDAIFCGDAYDSVDPDFVLLLIRNEEKNIFHNNEVMISGLDAVTDYFFLQKYIDLGGGKIKSRDDIDLIKTIQEKNGDSWVFQDLADSWIEYHDDKNLSMEECDAIAEKISSIMNGRQEDNVWGYFEYYSSWTVDIENFPSVQIWMTYQMVDQKDFSQPGKFYLFKDLVQKKLKIDNKKHKDRKNTIYLTSWISTQEASNLSQKWWLHNPPLSHFKICLTKRHEFNYDDTWYKQYKVNTNLVLPEYLEYLFLSDTVSNSLSIVMPPSFLSEHNGPNDIDGHDLTEEEQYNNLVFKLPSVFEQNKRIKTYKVIKEIKNDADNFLNILLDTEDSYWIERKYNQLLDIKKKINLLNKENSEILKYIKDHENEKIEFKSTWSMNLKHPNKKKDEKLEKDSVLKTICAFLNTNGGTLLVGIDDDGKIFGTEEEVKKYYDQNYDKFKRHILARLDKFFGADRVTTRIKLEIEESGEISGSKNVLILKCEKNIGTYLDNDFYVRQNGRTVQLLGEQIINYIESNKSPDPK